MSNIFLEHVNITVTDAIKSAELPVRLFGWKVRWQGKALDSGYTVHVGNEHSYLAFYAPPRDLGEKPKEYSQRATLSHIGVVVDDIEAIEARVLVEGIETHSHQDYEPGKRFYFNDHDGVEYEVVSYRQ